MIEKLQIYKDMEDLQQLINEKQSLILTHKAYLKATDYKIIKKYEGYEIEEDVMQQREVARNAINQLDIEIREIEAEIIELSALEEREEVL